MRRRRSRRSRRRLVVRRSGDSRQRLALRLDLQIVRRDARGHEGPCSRERRDRRTRVRAAEVANQVFSSGSHKCVAGESSNATRKGRRSSSRDRFTTSPSSYLYTRWSGPRNDRQTHGIPHPTPMKRAVDAWAMRRFATAACNTSVASREYELLWASLAKRGWPRLARVTAAYGLLVLRTSLRTHQDLSCGVGRQSQRCAADVGRRDQRLLIGRSLR
jgi:hypothetical protein